MPQVHSNFAQTKLAAAITDTDVTMSCLATEGGQFAVLGVGEYQLLTITDGVSWEIVKVSSRVGDVFTIERAYEGVAFAWSVGVFIKAQITKDTMEKLLQKEVYGASIAVFNYQNFR